MAHNVAYIFNFHSYRGLGTTQKPAIRKWYGQVGEIRAFLDSSVKLAVFTATASRSTKASIFSVLNLPQFLPVLLKRAL